MMDRRVKERLVGATILVALLVLVVPEMLSGPKPPSAPPLAAGLPAPTRNVSVDLATSKATPLPQESEPTGAAASAPDRDSAPVEAAPPPPPAQSAAASSPTVITLKAQEPAPMTLETPPPSPKSAPGSPTPEPSSSAPGRHGWAVQLGSFASKVNADKLMHQLQAHGASSVYLAATGAGQSMRYRVRVGPLADRGAAEREVAKLKAQGHAATIVTPAS